MDNLCLRYRLMPQDIPATCNGCSKNFSIKNALSFPKSCLVIAKNDDAAKKWGTLGSLALIPSDNTYETKINSKKMQGGATGAGEQQEGGGVDRGAYTVGEAQRSRIWTLSGATILVGQPG